VIIVSPFWKKCITRTKAFDDRKVGHAVKANFLADNVVPRVRYSFVLDFGKRALQLVSVGFELSGVALEFLGRLLHATFFLVDAVDELGVFIVDLKFLRDFQDRLFLINHPGDEFFPHFVGNLVVSALLGLLD